MVVDAVTSVQEPAMNTIIVPLDGSKLSERALGFSEGFARAYGARIAIVHVLEESMANDLFPSVVIPDRSAAEAYLLKIAESMPSDLNVSSFVLRGSAVDTLIGLTEDEPESMFVMSTHGRSGLGRLMLGSVADKVLRDSLVPVALVRGAGAPSRRLHSLLVPLDGSSSSEAALTVAVDLAQRTGATLALVTVCEPFWISPYAAAAPEMASLNDERVSEIEREALNDARAYLDREASEIRSQGIRVVWEVRFGKPADEILRASRTTEADLVVMATHDRRGIRRLSLGGVTNEVLHRGTTPILTIPPRLVEHQQVEVANMLSTF
jgi:nucleotide-binding universal stress UspA family protein